MENENQGGRFIFTFCGFHSSPAKQHTVLSKPRRLPIGPVAKPGDFLAVFVPLRSNKQLFVKVPAKAFAEVYLFMLDENTADYPIPIKATEMPAAE